MSMHQQNIFHQNRSRCFRDIVFFRFSRQPFWIFKILNFYWHMRSGGSSCITVPSTFVKLVILWWRYYNLLANRFRKPISSKSVNLLCTTLLFFFAWYCAAMLVNITGRLHSRLHSVVTFSVNHFNIWICINVTGMFIGTIVALVFSGLLCNLEVDNGWPLIFYVYGIT